MENGPTKRGRGRPRKPVADSPVQALQMQAAGLLGYPTGLLGTLRKPTVTGTCEGCKQSRPNWNAVRPLQSSAMNAWSSGTSWS